MTPTYLYFKRLTGFLCLVLSNIFVNLIGNFSSLSFYAKTTYYFNPVVFTCNHTYITDIFP